MGQRHHHYEAAFEAWLRKSRLPYVMVDEKRRALSTEGSLKSLDFIVSPPTGDRLLIDVKGRQFPGTHRSVTARWNNWMPSSDLAEMTSWETLFGSGFRGLLVFAYETDQPERFPELAPFFYHRERYYAFYGVWSSEYQQHTRVRSHSWETVGVPSERFRRLRFRMETLISEELSAAVDVLCSNSLEGTVI